MRIVYGDDTTVWLKWMEVVVGVDDDGDGT